MDVGLTGRVAVVIAASKGLGRATATALAAEGTNIVLNARNTAALDDLAATMPARLVDAAITQWGRVDIVVGNASGPPTGRALDVATTRSRLRERQHGPRSGPWST